MHRPADLPSLQVVLDAVSARIGAVGLRPVAREIGLDPKSVVQLLEGSQPRRSTTRKLEQWYSRVRAEGAAPTDVDAARAAVQILTRDLREPARTTAAAVLVGALDGFYESAGLPVPEWLVSLRAMTSPIDPG